MLFRRNSRLIVLLWQPSIAAICRWLLSATRRAETWYRCAWVSCRYFITASLWSVKPVRVPATALPPLPGYAKVLQLLSEFTTSVLSQQEILHHVKSANLSEELTKAFKGAIRLKEMQS